MTLDDLTAAHPQWTAEHAGWDLKVNGPDGVKFLADGPDDADIEIHKREPGTGRCCPQNLASAAQPGMTVEQLGARLAEPGF